MIFRCKMCGGSLDITDKTVAVCEYCGTKQTLPKLDNEKKASMYERAGHFRRNNEFDKAELIYSSILAEDKNDSEAYWSLVLCRYGIEYVEDPVTHKHIPTVNRAQYTSVFADENFKAALTCADPIQAEVYKEEAEAIDSIQKGILAISQKEDPFDIFICYKESDAQGRRTPDSVIAHDMYNQLTREGYKVFFSRVTLEDKLGTAYEPYIFAALNSAKIMIVVGTKAEYFNAVWVRNEWSRYLALVKSNPDKMLIPAYKDISPYDLPEEFAYLQAQDLGKLGYMQDIIRGINKIIPLSSSPSRNNVSTPSVNVNALLKRVEIFLNDGEFEKADEFCEIILNTDPENAKAYLGKLMCEFKIRNKQDFALCDASVSRSPNFIRAVKYGDNEIKQETDRILKNIDFAAAEKKLEKEYQDACSLMTARHFDDASQWFETHKGYKNSDSLLDKCYTEMDKLYNTALQFMGSDNPSDLKRADNLLSYIPNWKDSADLRKKLTENQMKIITTESNSRAYQNLAAEIESLESALRHIRTEPRNVGLIPGLLIIFVGLIFSVPFIIKLTFHILLIFGLLMLLIGIIYCFKTDSKSEALKNNIQKKADMERRIKKLKEQLERENNKRR